MSEKTYDTKSYELAEHFLADEPDLNTPDNTRLLAIEIQEIIEDWIDDAKAYGRQGLAQRD